MSMIKKEFGTTKNDQTAYLYTLENKNGMQISVTNMGAALVSAKVKNKNGEHVDVVLGYDSVKGYEANGYYLGATVGRNANRIENGRFTIEGVEYQLPQNDGENNLHSGPNGYSFRIWDVDDSADAIHFKIESPDGDQGYPGNFCATVTYTLTDYNEIIIKYEGLSDRTTIANLTNHSYFNLNGHSSGSILNHTLQISASAYTPVKDEKSIPTGEIAAVESTPMDFRKGKSIGRDIDTDHQQLVYVKGYDHNFELDHWNGQLRKVSEAEGDLTGIKMELYTDLPGVHLYSGNYLHNAKGKDGAVYQRRGGFCLETQYFPNAVNEPAFASPLLYAEKPYQTTTIFKFL